MRIGHEGCAAQGLAEEVFLVGLAHGCVAEHGGKPVAEILQRRWCGPAQPAGDAAELLLDVIVVQAACFAEDLIAQAQALGGVPRLAGGTTPLEFGYQVRQRLPSSGRLLASDDDRATLIQYAMSTILAERLPEWSQLFQKWQPLRTPALGEIVQLRMAGNLKPVAIKIFAKQKAQLRRPQAVQNQRHEETQLERIACVDEVDGH